MSYASSWTENQTIELEVEHPSSPDEVLVLQAEVCKTIVRHNNWGANADGRFGVTRYEIEEWEIETILDITTGLDVTEKFKSDPIVACEIEKRLEVEGNG